jgi:hypothetical protein
MTLVVPTFQLRLQIADPYGECRHTDNEQCDHNDIHCILLCAIYQMARIAAWCAGASATTRLTTAMWSAAN